MIRASHDRAQSEVVGEVLTVGLVVLVVSIVGVTVVLQGATTDERTLADVEVTAVENTSRVALAHQGGDAVAESDLRVRVAVGGTERTTTPNATASTGDADGRFDPGDRWVVDLSGPELAENDVVRVRVADDSTGTVLVDERVEPT